MSGAFRQFTMFQPMQTTTTSTTWSGLEAINATSTTWSGLEAINARCYGCIYSYVKCDAFICGHANRVVANGLRGQECVSFVPRNKIDVQPRGDAE